MSKPSILVDLDGVCADYLSEVLAVHDHVRRTLVAAEVGIGRAPDPALFQPKRLEDITDYDLAKVFGDHWPRMLPYLDAPGFFSRLAPFPSAGPGILSLQRKGFEVFICSSPGRSPTAAGEKWAWCRKHLPMIDVRHIILTSAKERVLADFVIDDSPVIARKIERRAKHSSLHQIPQVIVPAYPYNREVGRFVHRLGNESNPAESMWRYLAEMNFYSVPVDYLDWPEEEGA